jgi:hypothetical protein
MLLLLMNSELDKNQTNCKPKTLYPHKHRGFVRRNEYPTNPKTLRSWYWVRTTFMAIENTMVNAEGETVTLKPGAEVDVVIEAAVEDTIKKSDPPLAMRSA